VLTRANARGGTVRAVALAAACLATTATGLSAAAAKETGAEAATVTMAGAGTKKVIRYGEQVRLSGRAPVPGAGRAVELDYAPRGHGWRAVARTTTGADGSYGFLARPRRSGAYRALTDGGPSATRRIAVVARLGGRISRHVRSGSRVRVRGHLAPGFAGRTVRLQVRAGGRWLTVDRARTGRGGRFRASWRPSRSGRYRLRVAFRGDRRNPAASRKLGGRAHVYRPSQASWYGPGLYGNPLACGGVLGAGTLGVAHRGLPCGTRVTLRFRGRSLTVPVVDRGPFSGNREWDLTSATKHRLGFGDTGTVWVAH
jgi:rare lipoprotein A